MAKCTRHLKALTKKNFFIWTRTWGCSAFEVIAPIVLMIVLSIIRAQIPVVYTDQSGMLEKKTVVSLGIGNLDGTWAKDTGYDYMVDDKVRPFYNFADYTEKHDKDDPLNYKLAYDWHGPQFWAPSHCLKTFSWQRPRKPSPYIGLIGPQGNLTDSVTNYYTGLRKVQTNTAAALAVPFYKTQNYTTVQEFNDYVESPDYMVGKNKGVCFAIEFFVESDDNPNNYTFRIHFPDKKIGVSKYSYAQGVPNQNKNVWEPFISGPDLLSYLRYQHNGFNFVQNLLAYQILANEVEDYNAFISYVLQPMQTDTNVYDPFTAGLAVLMPLFLLLTFIPTVYNMVFKITREKETRAKETMRIMGMTDLPYWLSWFIFYTAINTVVSTLCWAILLFNVINYSQPMYIWLFFWLYGEAVFGQIIFLQSMFTGSKYAGIVSTVIYFCGVLVNKIITGDGITRQAKLFASLLPQVALMQGSTVFANYEGTGVGLDSSTAAVLYQEYSFNTALWMLAFDFVLFFFLGLYMDKVIPSDYGQRQSPCFLCMPSFWCPRSRRERVDQVDPEQQLDDDDFERSQMPADNYEAPPAICRRLESSGDYLRITNLQKTFGGGFRAVRGVNMKMYDSQIFALLGHNGAGKTTTISMLTGLIKKSAGQATCYDTDLFEEMEQVREFMGVCPQHDVLFDLLTPREHLDIFYDFKGGDPARKQQEINSLIADVGLTIDQKKAAHTLSGGNKRKLSVSIALCGGSKLVLLDEPTSGMDLGARRNLWDMLKSYKKERIIILTTHYMDEADVLGDRIGIMCKGTLQCIGSSLFLKNRFGVGYKITMVKKRRKAHPALEKFMQSYFSDVQKQSEVHDEISYVIPKNQAQNFGAFFDTLDQRLDEFDIRSYGVSMSNLEDVFLKINQEFAPDLFGDLRSFSDSKNSSQSNMSGSDLGRTQKDEQSSVDSKDQEKQAAVPEEDPQDIENLIRGSSCVRSCSASTAKRLIIYKRDWCGLLCQIVIPLILVLFGLWLTSGPSKLTQSPPRHLSTGWYPKQRILMSQQPVNMTDDGFDVMGEEFAAMLPNATSAFEVTYKDINNYTEFYDAVYEARNDGPVYPYRYGSYQIYQANKKSNLYNIVNFLNVTSQDVTAMYPQYMYQSILRVATGDPDFNFDVTTVPYPIYQKFKDIEQAAGAYDFVFMVAIALSLIPCVMVQFILNERELALKHQQLLSGMSLSGYWSSNIIFDVIMAYIPILLIIGLTFLFNQQYQGIWVLFLLYPPAIVPFTYVLSFLFKSDINAQIMTLFLHFVSGGLLVIIVFVLQYVPKTMIWGDALRWVFCIFPSFCVTHGILFSASGTLIVDSRQDTSGDSKYPIPRQIPSEIWDWYNLKGDAMFLILHFIMGIIMLAMIELEVINLFDWCPKIGARNTQPPRMHKGLVKDDDVLAEEKRVAIQGTEGPLPGEDLQEQLLDSNASELKKDPRHVECIRVHNFQKEYDFLCGAPVKAVNKASFALDFGECFALLGVNGAGKSTTFKSLTRDILPTTGEISIQGFDVQKNFQDARKLIGYCPQYDAIFPKLTVEETLKFYALVKGLRTYKIKSAVEKGIRDLNLKDHRNKLAGTLSGGNKRKLSVAMALLGNPPIILLDEPSAGMDPEARRFMWQVVEKISQRDKKSAVILTTHSMEEAEALSTKLGIMVRGGIFRCMGSSQHIKNKFGVGYEVEIKVKKAQYNELQEMAHQLGFEADLQTKVALSGAVEQCGGAHDDLVLDQIRKDGLGADLALEAELDPHGEVRLRNLLEFLHAQVAGFKILNFLLDHFPKVELLEQCGEFFKMRVPKESKTIGWLFGRLENDKKRLGIDEYSVTQTTLEQIFQTFANQSIASDKAAFTFIKVDDRINLVNPDHKMTEEQERLSQRGLSFVENEDFTDAPPKLIDDGQEDSQPQPGQLLLPKDDGL